MCSNKRNQETNQSCSKFYFHILLFHSNTSCSVQATLSLSLHNTPLCCVPGGACGEQLFPGLNLSKQLHYQKVFHENHSISLISIIAFLYILFYVSITSRGRAISLACSFYINAFCEFLQASLMMFSGLFSNSFQIIPVIIIALLAATEL